MHIAQNHLGVHLKDGLQPNWECSKQGIVESPHVHRYPTISPKNPDLIFPKNFGTLKSTNPSSSSPTLMFLVRNLDPTTCKPSNLNHQGRLQGPKGSKYPQWSQASQDAKKMPSPCEPPSGFTIAVSDWRVEWIVVGFDGFTLSEIDKEAWSTGCCHTIKLFIFKDFKKV